MGWKDFNTGVCGSCWVWYRVWKDRDGLVIEARIGHGGLLHAVTGR